MKIVMTTQPNDVTCGPTSLHAVYQYYGDNIPLNDVVSEVIQLETGGTIAVFLGDHALDRGYNATLYVYNLDIFDPTWFYPKHISSEELVDKLKKQMAYKKSDFRLIQACQAYCDFLEKGGSIQTKELTVNLLKNYFKNNTPIIAGLSCTYLYQSAREIASADGNLIRDDIRGIAVGHFVVLGGYNEQERCILVADPHENPLSPDNYYHVDRYRLIHSILLGTVTHDANLLVVTPKNT